MPLTFLVVDWVLEIKKKIHVQYMAPSLVYLKVKKKIK